MSGVILYEGPSLLDGKPIVMIATNGSKNVKTGDMIQTWILRSDIEPTEAVKSGQDASICGDCIHRGDGTGKGRSCYVTIFQAPLGIYRAYKRGNYERVFEPAFFAGKAVRLGAYGDPGAVPYEVLEQATRGATGHTGYTHAWRSCDPRLSNLVMASCDSLGDMLSARTLGYRTFRVRHPDEANAPRADGESLCPASHEAGYKLTCATCMACCGTGSGRRGGIVIALHGSGPTVRSGITNLTRSTV